MKQQSTFLYILRLSLTLLIITAVMAALLAGVNGITAQRIAEAKEEKTKAAIEKVLPDAVYIDEFLLGSIRGLETPDRIINVYMAYDDVKSCDPSTSGTFTGEMAVAVAVPGFDGEITMMVGISAEGTVLGISIISHTETAGLGAMAAADNAKGEAFRAQFVGMSGTLAVTKDGGGVDALTGATITSRAVVEGVNVALEFAAAIRERVFH